jgi:prepilin-type N-terminal cleavage/methylation domain-containing protein
MHSSDSDGFTLIELLLVVVILGMLAAIVVPASVEVRTEARQAAFLSEMRIFVDAATVYEAKTNRQLEDASSGAVPTGFEDFISTKGWLDGTPIGGVWDAELDSFGVKSALGVHFLDDKPQDDAYMAEIDALIDDGDLDKGGFRKIAEGRFYYIIAQS